MEPERSAALLGSGSGTSFADVLLLERALTHRFVGQ